MIQEKNGRIACMKTILAILLLLATQPLPVSACASADAAAAQKIAHHAVSHEQQAMNPCCEKPSDPTPDHCKAMLQCNVCTGLGSGLLAWHSTVFEAPTAIAAGPGHQRLNRRSPAPPYRPPIA